MRPVRQLTCLGGLLAAAACTIDRAGGATGEAADRPYAVVDTGQTLCYDAIGEMAPPRPGQVFYGQDAQYQGPQPSYRDNGDGTVSDLVTGLMWQKTPNLQHKLTFDEAVAGAAAFRLAGQADWRLPSIKELYSLIIFTGNAFTQTPYLDTRYFDFVFGNPDQGERIIDAQYWSANRYVGTVFDGMPAVFGVNFADGRIKGYGLRGRRGEAMRQFVRYVRGNPAYGQNDLTPGDEGTVVDRATGLVWQRGDSGRTLSWQQALAYAENLVLAGRDDWRLPNAKELQSIVDYRRAPDAVDAAWRGPALDPIFAVTEPESWYWTSTTHLEAPPGTGTAAVICFGQAFGTMHGRLMNVHGAGSQRSEIKSGDPNDPRWQGGHGPQGDQQRLLNYVRCVRG
ncbi:MAG: DUF1566 domain-containing protein [Armatimonadetes bacterium]|nr:DUF1566 domain-containing protein [Armatimonadota bacterium]